MLLFAFSRGRLREQEFEFEALPHLDELYRTAVRLLGGDSAEAQDLVQDVFAQAWKSFDRYEPGTNCRAWLYRILVNKAKHYQRRRYTRKVIPLSEQGNNGVLENAGAPPLVPEHIRDEEVLAALERLSDDHREVVLLADVQEFAYKEIAEILEIPIGTVMSRLSRGRTLLREALVLCAQEHGINTMKGERKR